MSEKFALTALLRIVVFGTNVLTIENVPLPLKGRVTSYCPAMPCANKARMMACDFIFVGAAA